MTLVRRGDSWGVPQPPRDVGGQYVGGLPRQPRQESGRACGGMSGVEAPKAWGRGARWRPKLRVNLW